VDSSTLLAVFAKHWTPGAAKTRLAARFGNAMAAEIARLLLVATLERFSQAADHRWIAFWPSDREADFAAVAGSAWKLVPQVEGNLGARIEAVLHAAAASGASRVVLIGADSPTLPKPWLDDAVACLRDHTAVLGPSADGGFHLLGTTGAVPLNLRGIDWGTNLVWRQTVAALDRSGVDYATLPPWYDVDTPQDLQRLRRELMVQHADEALLRLGRGLAELLHDTPGADPLPS
jgi:rSAM/selenodomain-associated transferase 1